MTTRIKLRRDTAANWLDINPTLALGEAGYDTTNNQIRIGDGTSTWDNLSPIGGAGGSPLTVGNGVGSSFDNVTEILINGDITEIEPGIVGISISSVNGSTASLTLTRTIPYIAPVFDQPAVIFNRPNNSANTVDAIDTGLTIKRSSGGIIYNSAGGETSSSNSQSPLGTRWNADGWGDLADVKARTYTTFYDACDQNVGENVAHREFVMHDTINDKYYTVKFTWWQPGNNFGQAAGAPYTEVGGFRYVRQLINTDPTVYFIRPADDSSIVDDIDSGLSIKRDAEGGIYNAQEDAEWDADTTPYGTLWNDDGWDDFEDITTRTWKPFYGAVHGRLGNHVVGRELLMHDTQNNKYYVIKFTDWGQNSNGGSFAYWRRQVDPTGGKLGITFADGTVQTTATVLGDLKVFDGNAIANQTRPGYGAEIRSDVKNNYYYNTSNWTGDANWVISGNDGYIQFDNGDTQNSNQVEFRQFLNDFSRWYIKTVSINGGEPQIVTNWSNDYIYTATPPDTSPTVVTSLRFDLVFRSKMYMGGENTVGFFLNDRDENFEVQSRDVNLLAYDDVRIRGRDFVEIRNDGTDANNDSIQIVTDGSETQKTWKFMPDGSIQLPYLENTGWHWDYGLPGSTLKLGTELDQTIITGAKPTETYPNAQRLIIQGQRGYGVWGQNTTGEGGDVYIWGGTGGERDGGSGGGGGDVKLRGGQGQNNGGGYVRIEAGEAYHSGGTYNGGGGFVEINAGDVANSGGGGGNAGNRGGDIRIKGGRAYSDSTQSGVVQVTTGGTTYPNVSGGQTWTFDNDGNLILPTGGDIIRNGISVLGAGGVSVENDVWVQTFVTDTPETDIVQMAISVEYDADGNIIALFNHYNSSNDNRYFSVGKFSSDGTTIWTTRIDAAIHTDGWGLAVDQASGFIYITGSKNNEGQGEYTKSILIKISSNGIIEWSRVYDFGYQSKSGVVDVASDGNPVIVGWADDITGPYITTTKIDATEGTVTWTRKLDGTSNEEAYGMAVGPSGEVVAVGIMPGVDDSMLVVKYDSTGAIQWQKSILFDTDYNCNGADADIDSQGNIYICGQYTMPNSPGSVGIAIVKLDSAGAKQWSRRVQGNCVAIGTSIVVGPDDRLYLSGVTLGINDASWVVAKYTEDGLVDWQRLVDNTDTGSVAGINYSGIGGGSNIAVRSNYVALGGGFGSGVVGGNPNAVHAAVVQVSTAGTKFTIGDWDFKDAGFSGTINNTASDITVSDAGLTDSDNSSALYSSWINPTEDLSSFLTGTILKATSGVSIANGDYSVSVNDNGVITMVTSRGSLEFGALPEPGGPSHFHIMKKSGDNADLFFGDDYNYVLQPGPANGPGHPPYGVEIGTNDRDSGSQQVWRFNTDGTTTFPGGYTLQQGDGTAGQVLATNGDGSVTWTTPIAATGNANTGDFTFVSTILSASTNQDIILQTNAQSWSFETGGILTLPNSNYLDTSSIDLALGSQGNVTIRSSAELQQDTKSWIFDTNGMLNLPGNMMIGTLWPNDPMPGGDKESVVWAKDDTEYLGLWWGGDMIYPEQGYGPVAGIMIGSGDGSLTDDFSPSVAPAGTQITVAINGDNGTVEWTFGRDGSLSLPANTETTSTTTGGVIKIKGSVRTLPGDIQGGGIPGVSSLLTAVTDKVIWTADSVLVTAAKITLRVAYYNPGNGGWDNTEIIELLITKTNPGQGSASSDANIAVIGRVKTNAGYADSTVDWDYDVDNRLVLLSTPDASKAADCNIYWNYDVVAFEHTLD